MKLAWKMLLLTGILLSGLTTARADFVGLNIGASHWAPDLSGSFNSLNSSTIDLVGDLGLDDTSQSSLVLTLEHPIPVLPNIRYQGFELDSRGTSTPSGPLNFEGQSYSGTVTSTFDLSHDDIVLYYELLDNWVNLDFGLDLKRFDGEVGLSDNSGTTPASVLIDETVPLLYISARFDLPFTGFYVGADINSVNLGDSSAEDSTIMLGYESGSGLGLEGGIKKFSLELDDVNNLNTNLEYDGIYLNGYFHF